MAEVGPAFLDATLTPLSKANVFAKETAGRFERSVVVFPSNFWGS
jgi:hypothetical protein